jgi:hypothetical protein
VSSLRPPNTPQTIRRARGLSSNCCPSRLSEAIPYVRPTICSCLAHHVSAAVEPPCTRRTKTGPLKQRGGGLVHGTGRVKPNGTIKRSDSTSSTKAQPVAPSAPKSTVPAKTRTVIDQGPVPLYCSDECQTRDLVSMHGALDVDYNPNRHSPPLPPVPHNSYSTPESESDSGTSAGSSSSHSWSSSPISTSTKSSSDSSHLDGMSPSLATLFELYKWKMPLPAPISSDNSTSSETHDDLQNGIIMSGRRITAVFRPQPKSKNGRVASSFDVRPTIPGWTDGSNAWRGDAYNFASPTLHKDTVRRQEKGLGSPVSYQRSYSSRSVTGESSSASRRLSSAASSPVDTLSTEELYSQYSQTFSRRSESRAAQYPSSSFAAKSCPVTAPRRERSLVHPGAEGKLLVPDVKLKARGGSSASLSSMAWSSESSRGESRGVHEVRDDDLERKDVAMSLPVSRPLAVQCE